jgi:hypothetical protein
MAADMRQVWLSGLDPVPIRVLITGEVSETAMFAAACLPDSLFMRTVRPYRWQQHTAESYELVIGPSGFGAVLLAALQWLARVAAAGIIGGIPPEHVEAFVKHFVDRERPDWRFEEITEHAATFLSHRYQLATTDAEYRLALMHTPDNLALNSVVEELRQWHTRRS